MVITKTMDGKVQLTTYDFRGKLYMFCFQAKDYWRRSLNQTQLLNHIKRVK